MGAFEVFNAGLAVVGGVASVGCGIVLLIDRFGYYSWFAVRIRSAILIRKIQASGFKPDLVIGLGRSGAILGGILAGNLGVIPLAVVDRRYAWDDKRVRKVVPLVYVGATHVKQKRVLLVDAIPHTGDTSKALYDEIRKLHPAELRVASLIVSKYSTFVPDYFVTRTRKVRKMPWRFTDNYREDYSTESSI